MINMFEDVAAPHTVDPTSKTPKKQRKTHWVSYSISIVILAKGLLLYLHIEFAVYLPRQWLNGTAVYCVNKGLIKKKRLG
jgi:hypothetical protein